MSNQISIIGCGWLGFPLATYAIENGYSIKGSTTSTEKMTVLKSSGIDPYVINLSDTHIEGDIERCLLGSSTLIVNIPPGLRKHPEKDFVNQMRLLMSYIEPSTIKYVLFISSTSVYADLTSIPTITEDSIPNPDSNSGKQLLAVEALFQKNQNFDATILRFAGLLGPDRHPATFLSGKKDLKNPDAPVNLIHQYDCIQIIFKIIKGNHWNQTFNASTIPHPSRSDYYKLVCRNMNLPVPEFKTTSTSKGKQIDSKKLIQHLDYEFQVKLNN